MGEVSFDVKDLLIELRNDVRAIDTKLELKADRERVHMLANDLAAMRLEMVANKIVVEDVRRNGVVLEDHGGRLDAIESYKNKVVGGFAVLVVIVGVLGARALYVLVG